jgi:Type IV secretion system proteins
MFKKFFITLTALSLVFAGFSAKADIFDYILDELKKQTDIEGDIKKATSQLPDLQQQTINQLLNTAGLNISTQDYNPDLQSWGSNMDKWQSVLTVYQNGGQGIGSIAQNLNQDFPVQSSHVANPNPQSLDAKYYTLQAQTVLASRAASQYDYENIKNQIDYMHQLLALIPKTKTVKDSMDLQNRIQIEGNLIQLEVLRLSALNNQQQAVQAQGAVNAIVNNANTFQ